MGDLIAGLAHINLNVPSSEHLAPATEFWAGVLGMKEIEVPAAEKNGLKWFVLFASSHPITLKKPTNPTSHPIRFQMPTGQQIHISVSSVDPGSTHFQRTNHPCFQLKSPEALRELQERIWVHKRDSGSEAVACEADEPGKMDSGTQGKEYPTRFFCRDFVGNR